MRKRNRTQDGLALAAAVGLTMLTTLVIAQAVLYVQDVERASAAARLAVGQAEVIARSSAAAAKQALATRGEDCSDTDLRNLKAIAFSSSYMSDVGKVRDGQIVCTALWGALEPPMVLPAPRFQRNGAGIWRSSDVLHSPYIATNIVVRGNVATVTSPSAFDNVDPSRTSRIVIATANGEYTFRSVEPVADARDWHRNDTLERSYCSDTVGVCAAVTSPRTALWSLPSHLLATFAGLGLVTGLCLGWMAIRYRNLERSLEQRLQSAIESGELTIVFQPLRKISDGSTVGFEALARWHISPEEEIGPDIFVPLAQVNGFGPVLSRYVLATALDDIEGVLLPDAELYVCINVEPEDIADGSFPDYALSQVESRHLRPFQVCFEVTERNDIVTPEFFKNMALLQGAGFRFLIDDFGTGHSNFSHLARTSFNGIKIDRLFTGAITTDSPLRSVLPAVYELALKLNLDVTIEGIETSAEAAMLRSLAPQAIGQGWFFGRPVNAGELASRRAPLDSVLDS